MRRLEHVCEDCNHSEIETDSEENQYYVCDLGSKAFGECQIVGSDDYFEKWNGPELCKPSLKTITFPILNNLTPTVESCTMKVLEEIGELMQLIGKGQRKSGEPGKVKGRLWAVYSVMESIDVAQAAITMAHTRSVREHRIDMEILLSDHEKKLRDKGYLK